MLFVTAFTVRSALQVGSVLRGCSRFNFSVWKYSPIFTLCSLKWCNGYNFEILLSSIAKDNVTIAKRKSNLWCYRRYKMHNGTIFQHRQHSKKQHEMKAEPIILSLQTHQIVIAITSCLFQINKLQCTYHFDFRAVCRLLILMVSTETFSCLRWIIYSVTFFKGNYT